MRKPRFTLLLTGLLLCAVAATGSGLEEVVIRGTVTDPNDAPVAGARLVLVEPDSGHRLESLTDGEGKFEFRAAPGRPYILTAAKPGFAFARHTIQGGDEALVVRLEASAGAPPQASGDPPPIADNSFLIEEAYNQEYGVVQHISAFARVWETRSWAYSFTQEWPINPAPRHQFSYTVTALSDSPSAGGGIGDTLLNWRYQVLSSERVAFAPRVSVLLPTGDSRRLRGAGGAGVEFNLPFSVQASKRLVTHWNAGTTIIPSAKNDLGDEAGTVGVRLGQSFIWQAHPRFNPMLETVFSRQQVVTAPSTTQWETSVIMNPGFRWAHNFSNGLQIVPGIAFPVELHRSGRGQWGLFLYLSFEHPFRREAK